MAGFSVTFEIFEPDHHGEPAGSGFVVENVSLRDAMANGLEYYCPQAAGFCEADCYPLNINNPPRWLTFIGWNNGTRSNYEQGICEDRTLHLPNNITPSSAMRVAKLFSCHGAK